MNEQLNHMASQVAAGKMNRREFMGMAAALGISTALASTMFSGAAHAAGPVKGGTIRVGIQGGGSSDSLDPAVAANATATQVLRLWAEPLLELNPEGGLWPRLAESFEASADARVWTFKIRSGVNFSNGQTMTADDVMATIERHSGEDTKSGALGLLRSIKDMRTDGDKFIIELDKPNADLPYLLTDYHLLIQPNGGKDDPTAAVGTGPYILSSIEPGVRFVGEKNPNYWDETVGHADTIELIVINDDTARAAALQSGQVHMINRVPPRTAELVGRAPNINLRTTSGPGHYVFIMHCDTAPFDNKDLRLALKYGINRQEMVDKILFGFGSVGNDIPINSSYPLFTELDQREYDPEKAKFHLKESGFDGSILLRTSDNSFPGAPDAAALFQQSCGAAGINIEIKREPNDGYWSEVWNKQPFCTSYWGGRPTQDSMYSTAYLSSADWNDTRFKNDQFDELLLAARGELDEAKRTQMYADMGTILHTEGGLICPMFNQFVDATTSELDGWIDDTPGFDLMNYYAAMTMWIAA